MLISFLCPLVPVESMRLTSCKNAMISVTLDTSTVNILRRHICGVKVLSGNRGPMSISNYLKGRGGNLVLWPVIVHLMTSFSMICQVDE